MLGVKSGTLGHAFAIIDNIDQLLAEWGGTTATGGHYKQYGTIGRPLEGTQASNAGFFGFKLFGNRPGSAGSSVRDVDY